MGTVDFNFAADLRDHLGLQRAVETGTFRGVTARGLAGVFGSVVTIELNEDLHKRAEIALSDVPSVRPVQGNSVDRLGELTDSGIPTFYFLDGHWSGGVTSGADDQCPVLKEIEAMGPGHADDCIVIDDARLFTSAPPPPHNVEQWPTLLEVFDAIRARHADHLLTVLGDQIIGVPARARPVVDAYGLKLQPKPTLRDHMFGVRNWVKQTAQVRMRTLRSR
jgi:hypothetical protein